MASGGETKGPTAQILDSIEEHSRAYMSVGKAGASNEHTFYFVHVRMGKGEGEVEIENPMYTVRLDRTKGTRLGLKLDVQVATKSLFIKEVVGGLAFAWNGGHADQKVRPGDRVVRVNKAEGDAHAMMDETKTCQMLELECHRGTAVPIVAGLSVTVRRPFGNFQVGQEGSVTKVDEEGDALMKLTGIGNQWVCKQDYDKFVFEDSERFYLKRYGDFKELYSGLKEKIEEGHAEVVMTLPELPSEERFGIRRSLSNLGMSSFMQERREALQSYLDTILKQTPKLDSEPLVAEFFGSNPIPDVGAATRDVLKQRLDMLVAKHRSLEEAKLNHKLIS